MNDPTHTLRPGPGRAARLAPLALLGAALVLTPVPSRDAEAGAAARAEEADVLVAPTADVLSAGSALVAFPWGDGSGEVGLAAPADGERRGPEAFAVAGDGRIAVLDSVNHRLQLIGPRGEVVRTIPLDLRSPRFLAATPERIHVLDADDDRRLHSFTWDGGLADSAALPPLEGTVTALVLEADGTPVVELDHDRTLPIHRAAGGDRTPSSARSEDRGRPADHSPGKRLGARMESDGVPRVELRGPDGTAERRWRVDPGALDPADHLVSLDADDQGRVVVGMRLRDRGGAGNTEPGRLLLARLEEADAPSAANATLLLTESVYAYLGQPYVVGGDGRVYAPVADPDGYRILVHEFTEEAR